MRSTSLRRKVLVVLFLVAVFPGVRPVAAQGLFSRIVVLLTSVWAKAGCHIDPSGRCKIPAPNPANQLDAGCNIDPNGRCRP